jgi:hypothetical protein
MDDVGAMVVVEDPDISGTDRLEQAEISPGRDAVRHARSTTFGESCFQHVGAGTTIRAIVIC